MARRIFVIVPPYNVQPTYTPEYSPNANRAVDTHFGFHEVEAFDESEIYPRITSTILLGHMSREYVNLLLSIRLLLFNIVHYYYLYYVILSVGYHSAERRSIFNIYMYYLDFYLLCVVSFVLQSLYLFNSILRTDLFHYSFEPFIYIYLKHNEVNLLALA